MTTRLPRPHLPSAQQFAAHLPSAHLSDEAVAAFADGVLSSGARTRAQQHLGACTECRDAVRDQRRATAALRSAPSPCLPAGLTDRLRNLPAATALPVNAAAPAALSADSQPMFAAFSAATAAAAAATAAAAAAAATAAAAAAAATAAAAAPTVSTAGTATAEPETPAGHQRPTSTAGFAILAATVVAVSVLAATAASAGGAVQPPTVPAAGATGQVLSGPVLTVLQFAGTGPR